LVVQQDQRQSPCPCLGIAKTPTVFEIRLFPRGKLATTWGIVEFLPHVEISKARKTLSLSSESEKLD
jgi:hypothetical protein